MKTQGYRYSFSAIADLLRRAIEHLRLLSITPRLVPIPSVVPHRSPSTKYARTSSGWQAGRLLLLLGVFLMVLSSGSAWAEQLALPSGVPNIFDPEVGGHFEVIGVTNLQGNPDFPMVL
ncbi:MAG TPA: hypothetical protein VEU07_09345, partial [Candidatus Acidoferrum sp.]|nr:hypothetical protein [Candidatus Acidoferrum sp.]